MILQRARSFINRFPLTGAVLCIGAATFLCYLPALKNGFVNWDDYLYVYENEHIRSLDAQFLAWSFRNAYGGNWHPLTLISHALDYHAWGLEPFGHHLTSVLLHSLNAALVVVLVWLFFERRQSAGGGAPAGHRGTPNGLLVAALTGLLFGLHPVHVESAAWVSERKDVLCAYFYLLGLIAYVRYVQTSSEAAQRPGARPRAWYLVSLGTFLLSLLSKPMAVTFPLILVLLDWYPLERTGRGRTARLVAEKLPFIAAGIATSLITLAVQHAEGAVVSLSELPLEGRIKTSIMAFADYLGDILYPVGLIPLYPYPLDISWTSPRVLTALLVTAGILAVTVRTAKRRPLWTATWGYYLITLLPVIGIVQVGEQARADRYLYLPSIGPLLLLSLGADTAYRRMSGTAWHTRTFLAAGLCLLCILSYLTIVQIAYWENGVTLWTHQIERRPGHIGGYVGRGDALTERGSYSEALQDLNHAVSLAPNHPEPRYYRGVVLNKLGYRVEAILDLTAAIARSPLPDYRYHRERADAYAGLRDDRMAVSDYSEAIRHHENDPELYIRRGSAYERLGLHEDAVGDYTRAIGLSPRSKPEYYRMRARAFRGMGRYSEAEEDDLR